MMSFVRETAWRAYRKIEEREHRLQYLFLEITRRCNLRCIHCGSDCSNERRTGELTTDSWIKIIDYVKDRFGTGLTFVLSGGEPLVHPEFFRIAGHIAEIGMPWGLVTNGMTLDGKLMDRLMAARIGSITLSVDGRETSHNFLRNDRRAFAAMTRALAAIGNSGVPLCDAVTCVHPGNIGELDQVAELLIEKKMPAWRLFRIFPNGRADRDTRLHLSAEQTDRMLDWIAANRPRYKARGLSVSASCEGYVPFKRDQTIRDHPFFCRAGINIAGILCDGTITGCTNNHEGFAQGNILRDDLATVWEQRFDDFRSRRWVDTTDCRTCRHLSKCRGGSIHLWRMGDKNPRFCYVPERDR